jgi:translation initiation factor IF-2
MKKIRINELARECEQPNSAILAVLPLFGVAEKKTHSSSVDEDVADKVRLHFGIIVQKPEPEVPAEFEKARELAQAPVPQAAVLEAGEPIPAPAPQPSMQALAEEALRRAEAGQAVPSWLTPEEQLSARPIAQPVRPPLAGRPAREAAPPELPFSLPGLAPLPAQPLPSRAAVSIPAKPVPAPKPGQIISGPRQPLPSPVPEAPRTLRPAAPSARAAQPASAAGPAAPTAPLTPASAPVVVLTGKANLAGQPAARPVIPPRPDLVERLRQTKAIPGQPQPRPGIPLRPQTAPIPGQPIYKGPLRPGQPFVARTRMAASTSAAARARGIHPTTPLRPEHALQLPGDLQRRTQKERAARTVDRELEREEKLLRLPRAQREEPSKLAEGRQITVAEGITVKELSEKLGLKANLVIKKLVDRKIFATINQTLDVKLAQELARAFGAETSMLSYEEEAVQAAERTEELTGPVKRAPVVTIMGHVDHGKTSLLDAIRLSNVAEREAGGITQHIGAYAVEKNGRRVVFIDTPGHEAFTRMRARGAKVTDIVVLVVAADDGVMPQTLEAIDHARAAGVPIIVAINKIDKPDAQPERVKQQLSDRGLVPEEWGGETVMVPVSARTKQNLELLLEMILLVADLQELKANPDRPAVATVLEAKLDRGRGPVATVLVRNGTLHVGDYFISGSVFGKVRALFDDRGQAVRDAEPSLPVEVIGLEALPDVGETMQVVTDTAKAKQIVIYRESKAREVAMARSTRVTLDQLHQQIKAGEVKELPIILKTDVGGSAEVLAETLQKLSTDKVKIQVIHSGVGAITETDVLLASASNAIIVGFNVRPERNAAQLAEQERVDVRLHTIIYELSDEIKRAISGLLEPVFREVYRGRAEVRETFRISKVGTVAGCLVLDGSLARGSEVRVLRDNVVAYTGKIGSLKRFKDDASEVRSGLECGLSIENFNDIKPGDIIESFITERVAAEVLV